MGNNQKKNFEPLPEIDMLLSIDTIDEVKTKTTGDDMLKVKFKVVNGDFKGRTIFENFLLTHKNPKVTQIAMEKLNKLSKAIGVGNGDGLDAVGGDLTVLNDYVGIPFIGSLKQKEPYNGRIDSTIKAFKAR